MPRASVPALCGGAVRVFLICEDDREAVEAQAGPRAHGALRAYDEWLRTELKHSSRPSAARSALAEARDRLLSTIEEHGIILHD